MTTAQLRAALLQPYQGGPPRFTEVQADYLVSRFVPVAYRSDGSGFQAVVFRDISSNQLSLAFRGTEQVIDIGVDLNLAGALGKALGQVSAADTFLADLKSTTSFNLLPAGTSLNLVGHSLGGHLAYHALGYAGLSIGQTYTFNGAGIGGPYTAAIASLLNANTQNYPNIYNVIADAGLSLVPSELSGVHMGAPVDLFTEPQGTAMGALSFGNHYMQPMLDSLAVHGAFEKLVGTGNLNSAGFKRILESLTDKPGDSLEAALNVLAGLFGLAPIALGATTGPDDVTRREALHSLAQSLYGNAALGTGTHAIISLLDFAPADLAVAAGSSTTGLAYRVALTNATPFIVTGVDYATLFNQSGAYNVANFSSSSLMQNT
jgi:hypothetical protein